MRYSSAPLSRWANTGSGDKLASIQAARFWGKIMKWGLIAVILTLAGCTGQNSNEKMAVASDIVPAPDCAPLPGWEEVATASRGKFLIFGETHGTQQSPSAVAEYICAIAKPDAPVLLAVELSSIYNPLLQAAWTAEDDLIAAMQRELPANFWERSDGVLSVAMLEMLVRVRDLQQSGATIDLVAFNGANGPGQAAKYAHLPGQEPHEAAQAENIRTAAEARDYAHVVVLVGGLHARHTIVPMGSTPFRPMAMQLGSPDSIVSLSMRHDAGSAWNCTLRIGAKFESGKPNTSDLDCDEHSLGANHFGEHVPGMAIERSGGGEYDGYFSLGPVKASPPFGCTVDETCKPSP